MDFLFTLLLLAIMAGVAWVAYMTGSSAAARAYQADVSTLRSANRRLNHEKADLAEELASIRRANRAMGIVLPMRRPQ